MKSDEYPSKFWIGRAGGGLPDYDPRQYFEIGQVGGESTIVLAPAGPGEMLEGGHISVGQD